MGRQTGCGGCGGDLGLWRNTGHAKKVLLRRRRRSRRRAIPLGLSSAVQLAKHTAKSEMMLIGACVPDIRGVGAREGVCCAGVSGLKKLCPRPGLRAPRATAAAAPLFPLLLTAALSPSSPACRPWSDILLLTEETGTRAGALTNSSGISDTLGLGGPLVAIAELACGWRYAEPEPLASAISSAILMRSRVAELIEGLREVEGLDKARVGSRRTLSCCDLASCSRTESMSANCWSVSCDLSSGEGGAVHFSEEPCTELSSVWNSMEFGSKNATINTRRRRTELAGMAGSWETVRAGRNATCSIAKSWASTPTRWSTVEAPLALHRVHSATTSFPLLTSRGILGGSVCARTQILKEALC